MERQNYEYEKKQREQKAKTTLTVAPTVQKSKEQDELEKQVKYDPAADSAASRKADMITRQINRSGLTRRNLDQQRKVGARYSKFEEKFGDVFEQMHQENENENVVEASRVSEAYSAPDKEQSKE